MRLPNGFGSVYKLSGNRRKPYVAKKTKGWDINPETGKAKQLYNVIGYYATRKEALTALSEYNANPYDISTSKFTLAQVYEKWSEEHFPTISYSNACTYQCVWMCCDKIADIKLGHLQMTVNESGKNQPMLKKLKSLFSMLWKYAIIHKIIPKEKIWWNMSI